MVKRSDLGPAEWDGLRKGLVGAGMLVSLSDRDLSDSFGEASAMAKFLAGQQVAGSTELIRELARAGGGSPFGFTAKPDRVHAETMTALSSSITILTAKAPDEVEPYRELVMGVSTAVADAKGGESPVEVAMIDRIRTALAGG
jgi:hypothetical protein